MSASRVVGGGKLCELLRELEAEVGREAERLETGVVGAFDPAGINRALEEVQRWAARSWALRASVALAETAARAGIVAGYQDGFEVARGERKGGDTKAPAVKLVAAAALEEWGKEWGTL